VELRKLTPSAKSSLRYHAPYMEWAKTRAAAAFDLAGSNIMACALDDLPIAPSGICYANDAGKIRDRLWAVGWAKRGPSGVIATNRQDSAEVAHRALADALTTAGVFERLMEPVGGWNTCLCDAIREQGGPMGLLPVSPRENLLPLELEEALEQRKPVRMEYLDARETRTERVIEPLQVRRRSGELMLVAHCHLRNDRRTFKLERIVQLRRIEAAAEPVGAAVSAVSVPAAVPVPVPVVPPAREPLLFESAPVQSAPLAPITLDPAPVTPGVASHPAPCPAPPTPEEMGSNPAL